MKLKYKFFINFGGLVFTIFIISAFTIYYIFYSLMHRNLHNELKNISLVTYYMTKNYYQIYLEKAIKCLELTGSFIDKDFSINSNMIKTFWAKPQNGTNIGYLTLPVMYYDNKEVLSNNAFVDEIKSFVQAEVSIFQLTDEGLVRIATTLREKGRGYDRVIGFYYDTNSDMYKTIKEEASYYGTEYYQAEADRLQGFHITATKPIYDENFNLIGAIQTAIRLSDISVLESQINSIKIGKKGFTWVIDSTGQVIAHPYLSRGNIYNFKDKNGRMYIKEMIDNYTNNRITFLWRNPKDKEPKLTLVYYNYLKEMDWFIASSYYLEEFNDTMKRIRQGIIFAMLVLVLLFTLLINFMVKRALINNIDRLIAGINKIKDYLKKDTLTVEMEKIDLRIKTKDEIEKLAETFEEMYYKLNESFKKIAEQNEQIKNYAFNLEELVRIRTEKLAQAHQIMKKELQMAQKIQESLIPKIFPLDKNIDISGMYIPMEDLGGDYYDVIKISDTKLALLIADVSGHGVPSALVTTMAKVSFNTHAKEFDSTQDVVRAVNVDLYNIIGEIDTYLTAFYCVIDFNDYTMEYTNAGHQSIIILRDDKEILLEVNSPFIGSFEFVNYTGEKIKLVSGDKIILYTDGIPEARNEGKEFYSFERFLSILKQNKNLSVRNLINVIISDISSFAGKEPPHDDVTILIGEIK